MDGQTDVHHVSRCPARAASLGHARARLIAVSPVIVPRASLVVVYDCPTGTGGETPWSRHIPLSPEGLEAIKRQLEAFRRKFGRDPNDNDPFFDPDGDDAVPLSDEKYEHMMIEAMAEVGNSQAMIFASRRTGRIVTEGNKHLLTPEELREWNNAVDEYHRRVESGDVI